MKRAVLSRRGVLAHPRMSNALSALVLGALGVIALAAGGGVRAHGGEYGQHYYPGTDGLKAASLNDPGFWIKMRTPYYYGNRWADDNGDKRYFKREIFFVEPELTWTTERRFLGARYEARAAIPLAYHIEDMRIKDDTHSRNHVTLQVGDLRLTPVLLGWDWEDIGLELTAGYTYFANTGDFDVKPAFNPALKADRPYAGKGYSTHMLNAGATYWFDAGKSWHATLMTHYEIHGRQDITRVKWGHNFHGEWGLGKDFKSGFLKGWSAGLAGYFSVQATDDDRPGMPDAGSGRRVFAAGVEIGYARKECVWPFSVTVRGAQEFGVKGHMRGFRSMLTAGLWF